MEKIDLLHFKIPLALLVMGHVVVLHWFVEHALIHQRGIPALRPYHKGGNVGYAHLECQQHHICLQSYVFTTRQHLALRDTNVCIGQKLLQLGHAHLHIPNHGYKFVQRRSVLRRQFQRKRLRISQHKIRDLGNIRSKTIFREQPIIQLTRITNGWSDLVRPIP